MIENPITPSHELGERNTAIQQQGSLSAQIFDMQLRNRDGATLPAGTATPETLQPSRELTSNQDAGQLRLSPSDRQYFQDNIQPVTEPQKSMQGFPLSTIDPTGSIEFSPDGRNPIPNQRDTNDQSRSRTSAGTDGDRVNTRDVNAANINEMSAAPDTTDFHIENSHSMVGRTNDGAVSYVKDRDDGSGMKTDFLRDTNGRLSEIDQDGKLTFAKVDGTWYFKDKSGPVKLDDEPIFDEEKGNITGSSSHADGKVQYVRDIDGSTAIQHFNKNHESTSTSTEFTNPKTILHDGFHLNNVKSIHSKTNLDGVTSTELENADGKKFHTVQSIDGNPHEPAFQGEALGASGNIAKRDGSIFSDAFAKKFQDANQDGGKERMDDLANQINQNLKNLGETIRVKSEWSADGKRFKLHVQDPASNSDIGIVIPMH